MIIERLEFYRPYKYIWLKKVFGVDLSKHCAKCLIGEYHPRFNWNIKTYKNIGLKGGVVPYYICGVDGTYKHHFHLAFREKKGSNIEMLCEEAYVKIIDAEAIPIKLCFVDFTHPNIKNQAFATCRNWWFAHWFAKEIGYISQ